MSCSSALPVCSPASNQATDVGIDIAAMWKLRDDVLTGKAPAAHLVAVFDKVLEELEVRRAVARGQRLNKNQLELFAELGDLKHKED